ncbi:hypothetical protein YC2023_042514 [Brassica napus]
MQESSTSDMVEEIFLTAKAKVMNNVALENKIIKAPKVGDLEPKFLKKQEKCGQKTVSLIASINNSPSLDSQRHQSLYHLSPDLILLLLFSITEVCCLISISKGLLETISIHLWANVEKFDSLHKPNTNTVGIAL